MVLKILFHIVDQELDGVGQKDEEDDEPVSFGNVRTQMTSHSWGKGNQVQEYLIKVHKFWLY